MHNDKSRSKFKKISSETDRYVIVGENHISEFSWGMPVKFSTAGNFKVSKLSQATPGVSASLKENIL